MNKKQIIIYFLILTLYTCFNNKVSNTNKNENGKNIFLNYNIAKEMILVEKGSFMMGSNEISPSEKPVHKVTLGKSFFIEKYEVTFELYDAFCIDTKREKIKDFGLGREKHPVIGVKWTEVLEFCNWLSRKNNLKECYKQTGNNTETWVCEFNANGYRLPTEAEWEYAARGGNKSKGFKYSGSNDPDEVAWHNGNSDNKTHIVGQKKPNELEIYDMSGNVLEWCWDWYNSNFYNISNENDPVCSSGRQKVIHVQRGGSYNSSFMGIRSVTRSCDVYDPQKKLFSGFRVVRTASQ